MDLRNDTELHNTRQKLAMLEEMYCESMNDPSEDEELHEAELHSIKRLINQLKEEIARYEAHHPVRG